MGEALDVAFGVAVAAAGETATDLIGTSEEPVEGPTPALHAATSTATRTDSRRPATRDPQMRILPVGSVAWAGIAMRPEDSSHLGQPPPRVHPVHRKRSTNGAHLGNEVVVAGRTRRFLRCETARLSPPRLMARPTWGPAGMLIWGTRTKREGVGFVVTGCSHCGGERVHFVAQSKTKFTLYFVPTFTTSTKALLICTDCERQVEVDGSAAQSFLQNAVPREAMVERLQQGAGAPRNAAGPMPPELALAVATVAIAMTAVSADGHVEDNEAAAVMRAIVTIGESTKSAAVRQAAAVAAGQFSSLIDYVVSPNTEPIPLMLSRAGTASRQLPKPDQYRLVGQLSWMCHTIAGVTQGPTAPVFAAMDGALASMGFSVGEIADSLAYCEANGG